MYLLFSCLQGSVQLQSDLKTRIIRYISVGEHHHDAKDLLCS